MEHIDRIFYINLDKRTDRKVEIEKELELYKENVERYPAIPEGVIGCNKSHLNVCLLAKQRGYKYIIIFEDDFEFIMSQDMFKYYMYYLFRKPLDFKLIGLSYKANNTFEFNEILNQSTRMLVASGYLINCQYIDEIIKCYADGLYMLEKTGNHFLFANDQIIQTIQYEKCYYFKERIGKQRKSYSDLGGSVVDRGY